MIIARNGPFWIRYQLFFTVRDTVLRSDPTQNYFFDKNNDIFRLKELFHTSVQNFKFVGVSVIFLCFFLRNPAFFHNRIIKFRINQPVKVVISKKIKSFQSLIENFILNKKKNLKHNVRISRYYSPSRMNRLLVEIFSWKSILAGNWKY